MKLAGEHLFNGPRQEVWALMRDPEALASALPGTQSLDKISANEYAGKMNVRVGPVAGIFSGKIVISDEIAPESYTLSVDGRGAPGFATGTGNIKLVDQGDGTTLMQYEGDLQIGGKLAGVGQRLLDSVSKSMIRQGLESLNNALHARLTGQTGETAAAYVPPSEMEFAAGVVKDLTAELFSPAYQNIWLALAVALVSFALGFWFGGKRRNETMG